MLPRMTVMVHGVEVSWDRRRDLFSLDPAVTHLNHGAFGGVPTPVQRAQQRLRDELETNPMAFFTRGLFDRIDHTRRHLAGFLGADPDGTALVANATSGAQTVLRSFDFGPDDEILLTDHGYGAVRLAVERLAAHTGVGWRQVAIGLHASDEEVVEAIAAGVGPRTRLVVVDHVTSATARLLPVDAIVNAVHDRGVPVLIDGAHAPAMLPLDLSALGADFWVGNLHKWAFAPRPTALLVVAEAYRSMIEPLIVSWNVGHGFPSSIEYAGTLDYTSWLAAPTAVHVLRTLGLDRIQRHNAELAAYGQEVIAAALGVEPAALPQPGPGPVSMRIIPVPPELVGDVAAADALRLRIAADLRCEVSTEYWNGQGFVRICAHVYNRREDYEQLASGLARMLRASG
jgi:isopenicillin-N epimerase